MTLISDISDINVTLVLSGKVKALYWFIYIEVSRIATFS